MNVFNVLIVEDESVMALRLRETFAGFGHNVVGVAKKGETAIALARIENPDLLILDIKLKGGMDGIETARKILGLRPVGIIFITAYSDVAYVRRALKLPCVQYLVKPVHDAQICVAVETIRADMKECFAKRNGLKLAHGSLYNPGTGELEQNGNPIRLTKTEKRLLDCLCKKPGLLVDYRELEHCVWPERSVSDSTRKNLINILNKKFNPSPIELRSGHGIILNIS